MNSKHQLSAIRRVGRACGALLLLSSLAGCGKDPLPNHNSEPRPRFYVFGDQIGFGYGGDARRFLGDGWTKGEQMFTWTKGLGAWMEVRVGASDQPLTLKMKMNGLISSPQLPFQPVEVSVNGRKIAAWKVAALKTYTAEIPVDMVQPSASENNPAGYNSRLLIDFYTPKASSPSELNINRDARRLGVCVWEMFLTQGSEAVHEDGSGDVRESAEGSSYAYGTPVRFGGAGNSSRYKVDGWYDAESTFTWFGKQPASLGFRVPKTEQPLLLRAKLAALVKPPRLNVQPAEVYVNGRKLAEWEVGGPVEEFSVAIPADLANETGVLTVRFVAPKAVTPNSLDAGADLRALGVQCHELIISQDR